MKILITGNLFHGYDNDIYQAILQEGHNVDFLFHNIQGPFNNISSLHKKLIYGILPNKIGVNYFEKLSIEKFNEDLLKIYNSNSFDLVIIIGGKTIYESTLEKIKTIKVFWLMDGINFFPKLKNTLKHYDYLFLFEPTDLKIIKELVNHNNVFNLNLGFSTSRFFNQKITDKKYDFSFIGSYYENREKLISNLLKKNTNGIIIGDFNKTKNKLIKKINIKTQIPVDQTNTIYNTSKININSHHIQSIEGLNVRTYEVMGSGGVQLVENKKIAQNYFHDGEHCIFYSSNEEFIDKYNFYIEKPYILDKIREKAYENAIVHHTWNERIKEMLQIVNL